MPQVKQKVELELVVRRLHLAAQLVKDLIVLHFVEVRQFVHGDHAQELERSFAKDP